MKSGKPFPYHSEQGAPTAVDAHVGDDVVYDGPRFRIWMFDLFFRPKRFFQNVAFTKWPGLVLLCAMLHGLATAGDRIDRQYFWGRTQYGGQPLINSWEHRWITALWVGVIAAAMILTVGGWWYRMRLRLAGAVFMNKPAARRVYLYSLQIIAIPALAIALSRTLSYPTPDAAARATTAWAWFVVFVFNLWSVIVSYCGARAIFRVTRVGGWFWFMILPGFMYSLVFFGFLSVTHLRTHVETPGTAGAGPWPHAQLLVMDEYSFELPPGWTFENRPGDSGVRLQSGEESSAFFRAIPRRGSAEQHMNNAIMRIAPRISHLRDVEDFETFAGLKGRGKSLYYFTDGVKWDASIFILRLSTGRHLECIMEVCDEDDVERALEMIDIEGTFQLR